MEESGKEGTTAAEVETGADAEAEAEAEGDANETAAVARARDDDGGREVCGARGTVGGAGIGNTFSLCC